MKLEDQVVSLELAKKLKALNVKQESYFYWYKAPYSDYNEVEEGLTDGDVPSDWVVASAFTIPELGEMLGVEAANAHIQAAYGHVFNVPDTRFTTARGVQLCMTDPNIGAKMLIYLLENKLLTSPK